MKILNTWLIIALIFISTAIYATNSSQVKPPSSLKPQAYQAYVNTGDCTQPLQSSPYVIIAGNGGANMNLQCPIDHPVMYSWKQQVGFGGFGAVSHGGGRSWISCCALQHRYGAVAQ